MKTQKEKKNKTSQLILKLIIGALIGASFGFGIGKVVKSNGRLVTAIEKNLQENCDCENVESSWSAVGIQFSKKDGFSNSSKEFTLENCILTSSVENEAMRLHTNLKRDIDQYDSVDLITFNFKTGKNFKTVKIKEGRIVENELR